MTNSLELSPNSIDAYGLRARIDLARGKIEPALKDISQAIELNPSDSNDKQNFMV